jgi:aspartate racemase
MKTLGVIGGMGPMATLDLFSKIIRLADGRRDQDFPHIIIDNNSKIPDRTAFILGEGEDPTPALVESAVKLVQFGAKVLAMPCNTAHFFHGAMSEHLKAKFGEETVTFLNMIEETVKVVCESGQTKVLLLGTDGTLQSGLYQAAFSKRGIHTSVLNDHEQRIVMKMIYDYKAGERKFDAQFLKQMLTMDDRVCVLGCTELPLVFEIAGLIDRVINPTEILAKKALEAIK